MKKVIKLKESDLVNIIKKVMNEATPVPKGVNKLGPGKCTGDMIVSTGNGCTSKCNGAGGYTPAQGSAITGNACSDPIIPINCVCSKGGVTRK